MRKKVLFLCTALSIVTIILGLLVWAHGQASRLIHVGDPFPEIPLRTPEDPMERAYLGLPLDETFTLNEIDADLILVEILSVYCMSCQRKAPVYNRLHERIETDPLIQGRLKIIGIAAGNGELEIQDFRQNYEVPFPIFPDPRFVMHRAIGESRTPFTIFVRQGNDSQAGLVARTHLGIIEQEERLLEDMRALMTLDLAAIRKRGRKTPAVIMRIKPMLSKEELRTRVKSAMKRGRGALTHFEEVSLDGKMRVYTGLVEQKGRLQRLFAQVVSRPAVCDVCHDVHFFYVFDAEGKVIQLDPLQLTKWANEPWSEEDLTKIRERLVGHYIFNPFTFDPRVDAVTSATITTALIFDSLSQGQDLFRALKKKGLIQ